MVYLSIGGGIAVIVVAYIHYTLAPQTQSVFPIFLYVGVRRRSVCAGQVCSTVAPAMV